MSLSRQTPYMDIYVEERMESILIRQRVNYNWLKKPVTLPDWTITQKRKFHSDCDTLIWNHWGQSYFVKVRGTSSFAQRNYNKLFKIKFDIKWDLNNPQWTINATKIPKGGWAQSSIIWAHRVINFDTEDVTPVHKGHGNMQRGVLHEYGHVIGNSPTAHAQVGLPRRGDEYLNDAVTNGGFNTDYKSIMNTGEELRRRHLDYVINQLNLMLPQTTFYI